MGLFPLSTADSSHNLTSRAGLAILANLMAVLKLSELVDQAMPVSGSNRGYTASVLFDKFMLLLNEGVGYLDAVSHLNGESMLATICHLNPRFNSCLNRNNILFELLSQVSVRTEMI